MANEKPPLWKQFQDLLKGDPNQLRERALEIMAERGISQDMGERAWNMAWELGHCSGPPEVLLYLEDLVLVIKGEE